MMKVVQCWDDGVVDDIRLGEILRKHGARASFNLNFGNHRAERHGGWKHRDVKEVWRLSLGELCSVYEGFTIGNHSWSHPSLTALPFEQAVAEVRRGRDALEQHFGRAVTGFAYPNGQHNADVHRAVASAGHVYARTTGRALPTFPPENPMAFDPTCHFRADDFWARYEQAKQSGGVFYFWGHSYEILAEEDWQRFDAAIARISADPAAEWADLPDLFEP